MQDKALEQRFERSIGVVKPTFLNVSMENALQADDLKSAQSIIAFLDKLVAIAKSPKTKASRG
jgi:hypothetical protein